MTPINSLSDLQAAWRDEPASHQAVFDACTAAAEADQLLNDHWLWSRQGGWGFGHISFSHVWHLIVAELPSPFRFLEIGVYRGQTTSLVGALAQRAGKEGEVVGLSTFDARNLVPPWPEPVDHLPDVWESWRRWVKTDPKLGDGVPQGIIFRSNDPVRLVTVRGDSTNRSTARVVREHVGMCDCVYVDGSHELEDCRRDLELYSPLVKPGGFLVCDDAAHSLKLAPGQFHGFPGSSQAVDEFLPPVTPNPDWEAAGSVCHLRVWRRR